jgi:hypothetical protein
MREPCFDIFRGASDKDAVWVEAVEGFSNARERMEEIATAQPDQYFVFSALSHTVLVRIDTRKSILQSERDAKSA